MKENINVLSKEHLKEIFENMKKTTGCFTLSGCSASIIGPTGVGKTVLSNAYSEENVTEMLADREGDGLASLVPTYLHPTDIIPSGYILIVARLKKDVINTDKNREFFAKSIYAAGLTILKESNVRFLSLDEMKNIFQMKLKDYYMNEISKKDNTSFGHMLSFLSSDEREQMIDKFVNVLAKLPLTELIEIVRKPVKTKKSSDEIEAIQMIKTSLDENWNDDIKEFWSSCTEVAEIIRNKAFKCADYDDSGLIYLWLKTDDPLELRNMFLNSEERSVEFLFEKMDIYYRISDEMITFINEDSYAKNMLKTRFGSIFFTINDTQGLFHESDSIEKAVSDSRDHIYKNNSELVLFCVGAKDDALSKKAFMVLKELKSCIRRDVDFLVVMPRIDELVAQLNNKSQTKNRFSKTKSIEGLSSEQIIGKIEDKIKYLRSSLNEMTTDGKRSINIVDVIAYGMYSDGCPDDVIDYFNPIEAFENVIRNLSKVSYDGSDKVHVSLDNNVDDVLFNWNGNEIDNKIRKIILESKTFKNSVYIPVISNIKDNMDKTGHGNSCRAVVNKSEDGLPHNGTIDMSWFVNVESIDIQFPAQLWSLATNTILKEVLHEVDIVHGVFSTEEDKKLFYEKLESAFTSRGNYHIMHTGRRISAKLFYYNHIVPYKKKGFFSYSVLLKKSLRDTFESFSYWSTGDVSEIVKAYKDVVIEVSEIIKDKYVIFDK